MPVHSTLCMRLMGYMMSEIRSSCSLRKGKVPPSHVEMFILFLMESFYLTLNCSAAGIVEASCGLDLQSPSPVVVP